ncbi:MAG: LysE family transporter [Chloroflexi bacterium]|nr:LysE family transporter [Chloroflexota bacterium]
MSEIIRGIILGLSITAPVGPTNVEVIRRGAREGARSAAAFCLGVIVALVIYLALVVFGLSFLTESVVFNTLLTLFGIIVLAYLSYSSIRDFFTGTEVDLEGQVDGNKHFVPGIVLTISNPAVLLLWTGIMGADLAASDASLAEGLLLSLGILIGVAIFFSTLTTLIHYGRRFLQQRYLRYVSLVAGIVQLFFCIGFAYDLLRRFL